VALLVFGLLHHHAGGALADKKADTHLFGYRLLLMMKPYISEQ
jgi:hypothetical protein